MPEGAPQPDPSRLLAELALDRPLVGFYDGCGRAFFGVQTRERDDFTDFLSGDEGLRASRPLLAGGVGKGFLARTRKALGGSLG